MSDKTFDPVSLGILWDRLISITDEIVSTLVRTSFSTNVRESYDLSCVLFDAEANPIAQGSYSVPSSPAARRHPAAHAEATRRDTLQPGDVVVTNDPWMGTGHLYDISVMRPVFRGRARRLHAEHHTSAGHRRRGLRPGARDLRGGAAASGRQALQAGKMKRAAREIIRTNVRVSEQVIGDIMANVSCNEVGGRDCWRSWTNTASTTSRRCRRPFAASPRRDPRQDPRLRPGSYSNRSRSRASRNRSPRVRMMSQGETVAIDFSGTGGCVRAGINVPFCYTRDGAALHQVPDLPETPNNEGRCGRSRDHGAGNASSTPCRPCHRGAAFGGPFRHAAGIRRARQGGAGSCPGRSRHDEPRQRPGRAARRAAVSSIPRRRLRRADRISTAAAPCRRPRTWRRADRGLGESHQHDRGEARAPRRIPAALASSAAVSAKRWSCATILAIC